MQDDTLPRLDRGRQLFELADRQVGYFTAAQALKLGYSYRAQHHHKRQGNWLEEGWGIYRLRDYPHAEEEEMVRLALWSRDRRGEPQAVVSHETALSLYELSDLLPAATHLTVPLGFRKAPPKGVVLHKAKLSAEDIRERSGYRVTTPLRTLLDVLSSPLSPEHGAQAVREALERGLVRRRELEAVGEESERLRALLAAA